MKKVREPNLEEGEERKMGKRMEHKYHLEEAELKETRKRGRKDRRMEEGLRKAVNDDSLQIKEKRRWRGIGSRTEGLADFGKEAERSGR